MSSGMVISLTIKWKYLVDFEINRKYNRSTTGNGYETLTYACKSNTFAIQLHQKEGGAYGNKDS